MEKYVCTVCGYVYDEAAGDPDNGIAEGTVWADVPEDYVCPLCGVGKDQFEQEQKYPEKANNGQSKSRNTRGSALCLSMKQFAITDSICINLLVLG